ncbi:GNAT family N-acetyltransferase [Hymenobacter sp. 5317J-9]|uniref:GNAT family N-acetyltransferase n=1 Tax=Hymenobacter sp. 5317J-9 TaxID=2932250 RepID=UPI001FD6DA61|nr:GNAT family N-acetyltransferase [Hymenobacter sp. 5317J-9]UOQ99655.1 GNAT family N-acetyltransferase [Hymenobacter sp. 5317J-9]
MTSSDFVFRWYRAADEAAVMALFRSNIAPYFLDSEASDLCNFLRQEPGAYFVAEWRAGTALAGQLAAAGGYALNNPHAVLTWGMVDRSLHGQGVGRAFTQFRIAACRQAFPGRAIEINTSQHTAEFYEKLGFRTLAVEVGGWGPGLDNVHMLLPA